MNGVEGNDKLKLNSLLFNNHNNLQRSKSANNNGKKDNDFISQDNIQKYSNSKLKNSKSFIDRISDKITEKIIFQNNLNKLPQQLPRDSKSNYMQINE